MDTVKPPADQLADLLPYDPQYMPAETCLSANENPADISGELRQTIADKLKSTAFNRYPDPLANDLRDKIASAHELSRNMILVGNGGDELLFNLALAWGGPNRKFMNFPPTFSVYTHNAKLTGTEEVALARKEDFSIDEGAVLTRVAQGDIDFIIITSPNNPTGDVVNRSFLLQLLDASDALVLVDEAYAEFSQTSAVRLISQHKNLAILRTFSKAYCLAGVRLGYLMAQEFIINELIKVRQPYSVDAVSQLVGSCVFERRADFETGIDQIIAERDSLISELSKFSGLTVYPSSANYILFRVDNAEELWKSLYDRGVLIRDFSRSPHLENCLRVSVGSPRENQAFLAAMSQLLIDRER